LDLLTIGTVFQGRYEILSKLGEGGFGQVYLARQLVTHHEVAIKVLRPLHTDNATHIARFQREMQLCAQLYHPHIVRLIDSGKADKDLLYTVFVYVPGRTLTEVLTEERALNVSEAAQLMVQVLDALSCAHARGVVHRDLKPQNIMVSHTGVRRNALVLDFGLGTLPSENQEAMAKITHTREVLGTPTYASPEQLRGESVTPRSDLYSWGLIFLECLTGRRSVEGATLQQIIFNQLGPEPIAVPAWLENHRLGRLLRKVTQKNPELRDVSALSILRELEACTSEGWPAREAAASMPTPAQLSVPDTLPTPIEGERRQLTAVCCSLRLSEGGSGVDEEDLDRLLRGLYATCAEVARAYDGHVGSVLGDWMLFYFGYPRAQEDDARRAARAALEMSARMEKEAARLAGEHKGRVDFRVALHTGLVISQEARGGPYGGLPSLMGTAPKHAVRLESQARPGDILLSQDTSQLLRGHFAFEPFVARPAASAAPVFRLLHEYKGGTTHFLIQDSSQLYGRAQELDYLQQRWWQVAAGTGPSVLLTGEPGIGKSRLVQELIRQSKGTPHTVLESRCVPEGRNSALSPMVDLLERLLGIGQDWKPEQTLSALEAFLAQHGFEPKEAMPLFLGLLPVKGGAERYPPPDVSPQRAKELTLEALSELFFEMAQQQPLLLLVEDLHWSDPTTLELLSHMVKDVASAPLCLVLTARQEFAAPWAMSHHLQLSRLDRQRVEEMVNGLTQNRPVPRELMEQLINRTDGVPLFVEELTRVVAEALPRAGATPSGTVTPSHIAIPTTLRDSLTARLDRLGPAKELAQLASALGREFNYEVLKAICQREEPTLQAELKTLVDADLVSRRRGVRNPTYLFKHALIRDTAYESMLRPVRRQVHARIAATLEAHFPELVETRPELLALHHSSAGQKREAIGYAQKAGMAALMRSANQEAIAYITEALTWLDVAEDAKERAQLELGLNSVLTPAMMATRGWSDASIGALVERSQQLIDVLGDSPQTVPTLWGLTLFHLTRGAQRRAQSLAERMVAMAKQTGSADLEMMARNALGNSVYTQGKLAEALACFEPTLATYEPARHQALASLYTQDARSWAEGFVSWVKWLTGYPEQADVHSRRSLEWALTTKHTSSIGLAYLYRLGVLQWRGEREKLIETATAGEELLKRHGLPVHALYPQAFRCWANRDAEPLRQALAILEGAGLDLGRTCYKLMLAEVELETGRKQVALDIVEELIQWGRSAGELYDMAELLRVKSLCLRAKGEPDAAEAVLREAISLAREQGAKMLELKAATVLGEMLGERGRPAEAREMLAPLVRWFTEGLDTLDLIRAQQLLGRLST
jgi:TOMM system kinase/cyclase fusion protein